MTCPYEKGMRAVAAQLDEAVQAVELHYDSPKPDEPFGCIVLVYCRDCSCTHASHFGAKGTEAELRKRIHDALCVAIANNNQESEYFNEHEEKEPRSVH